MIRKILETCCEGILTGKRYVLATVVMVSGSSYRGPGARQLIGENLGTTGEISGGCLDADVLEHARLVLTDGKARLRTYDTRNRNGAGTPGPGPGCTGLTKVLLEPIGMAESDVLHSLLAKVTSGAPFVIATVFDEHDPQQYKQGTLGIVRHEPAGGEAVEVTQPVLDRLHGSKHAEEALMHGSSYYYLPRSLGSRTVLLERVEPEQELIIAGTGDDVLPILSIAEILGWRCKVAGHMQERLLPARFPTATTLVLHDYKDLVAVAQPGPSAFVLIMTHNYQNDMDSLCACMNAAFPYVGLLGPKKKSERMLADLAAQGIVADRDFMARFHNPMGLDLGGETSQEVALSILAGLVAIKKSRSGGMLRDSVKPIHDR